MSAQAQERDEEQTAEQDDRTEDRADDDRSSTTAEQGGASRRGTALKIGALAATAGGAALVASRAMGGKSMSTPSRNGKAASGDEEEGPDRTGNRADQMLQAVGLPRWERIGDLIVPFAENAAASAGTFVAKEGPEIVTDRLLPRFIDAFNKQRRRESSSGSD